MNSADLARILMDWFALQARDLPWRRTSDPYGVWVSEVMLQQTQVRTVIPYWERWMRELPDVEALARAEEDQVLKLWEGLGYYRRARHLQAAARLIVERHRGRFPRRPAEIQALPGVGRYTAGAVASIAFNQPEPILDGNVVRVLTRLGALVGDPRGAPLRDRLWRIAKHLVQAAADEGRPEACSQLNQALMELGAIVCLPSGPQCELCPVRTHCRARAKGRQQDFPMLPARPPPVPVRMIVVVLTRGARFWVRRRPLEGVNAGLWEFPSVEVGAADGDEVGVCRRLTGAGMAQPTAWWEIRHAITRFRITQKVYRAEWRAADRPAGQGCWRTLTQLEDLAFTAAHRRIVRRLGPASAAGALSTSLRSGPATKPCSKPRRDT